MKLYFHPWSGSSRRVLLAVEQLKVPVERVLVDLPKGEQRGAPHVARNPNGRIPVLEDGDFTLWESRAIMQYLAGKTPGQTLYPTELQARADVDRWLFWCAVHMNPPCSVMVRERFVKQLSGAAPDPVEVARGEALFHEAALVMEKQLAGKEWITQGQLTLADLSLASSFALAGPGKFPWGDYPNIRAWFARVEALDCWKKTQPKPPGT